MTRYILTTDDIDDYCEYLASEGYRVTSCRMTRDERFWKVTFTTA